MSEFKHWLDETSEADDFERAVLRAGLDANPPATSEAQVWSGVLGALALSPVAAGTHLAGQSAGLKTTAAGAGKAAAVSFGVAKGFVVGLAIYGAASGASELAERISLRGAAPVVSNAVASQKASRAVHPGELPPSRPPPGAIAEQPAATAEPARPSSATGTRTAVAPPRADPSLTALPSVAAFPEGTSGARASQLQAETAALRSARAELRAGKLSDAFATLAASRRQFSAPELDQEREALTIELLHRSGQVAAARQRARAFLVRFADSPHTEQVRKFAAD